ncbi:MAG: hypothetical protein M0P69_21620 [Bacteroidales bacterium]|nr:hypothetical protein [Candidatus Cloacimonadota bacterium]MCK9328110.1 hypothetical protein [Bacteroidales bacterium]
MLLSKAHTSKFWRLFQDACQESLPIGCDKEVKDAFRKKIIFDSTGQTSLTRVRPGQQYELLMAATAEMSDNYDARVYWSTCQERKFIHLIGACTTQIGQIAQEPHAWSYVKGVLQQAHWPDDWQDVSSEMLHSVFMMLDTHRRRLLQRTGWAGAKHDQPLGFKPERTYIHTPAGLIIYRDDLPATPAKP